MVTPFQATVYTLDHLNLEPSLRRHIAFGFYESGHLIYANERALQLLPRRSRALVSEYAERALGRLPGDTCPRANVERMEGARLHLRCRVLLILGCFAILGGCAGRNVVPSGSAVFDSASSVAAAAPTATPRGLYTDAQLRTAADPNARAEPKASEAWTAANTVPVRSETYDKDFSDLAPFGAATGNRRIVGLGESSHGVGDYSLTKTRLIKYLHEKKGFDVIVFEYDMFDDYVVNKNPRDGNAGRVDVLRNRSRVWWSTEALGLFDYLQQQAKTKHPLILAGMDVQENGMIDQRAAAMQAAIAPVDAEMATNAATYDPTYVNLINRCRVYLRRH